jgi:hypothetical protein
MRFEDKKFALCLIFACVLFVICVDLCEADKNKHKNKPPKQEDKNESHHHHHKKNHTNDHHHNHTAVHNSSGHHEGGGGAGQDIGWSLHNQQGQPAHPQNPNGFALQHHGQGHDSHPHQGHSQQHPQPAAPQPSAPQPDSSGPSALGAGVGGLALGALGGAAGGYLLSNALNKDEKTEEKPTDNEITTLIAAIAENSTETSGDSTTTTVAGETVASVNAAPQNLPIEAVSSQQNETSTTVSEASTPTTENAKDKNGSEIKSFSVVVIAICLVASFVIGV